jgi:hypothetical protein
VHRTEGANNLNNLYTEGPPATTITGPAMNSLQEEIANVIEQAGITLQKESTDTRDQLWTALQTLGRPYDIVVSSQSVFNSMIERTGANAYKIKDEYKSVFLKSITGGYACAGAESFLSGGDSWGYIKTNNCINLIGEGDTFFDFIGTQGFIWVDTENALIFTIGVSGDLSTAANIQRSFFSAAENVTFINCSSKERKSNQSGSCSIFEQNPTGQDTSRYIGCSVTNCSSTTNVTEFAAFKNIRNSSGCSVYNLNSDNGTINNELIGFLECNNLSSCTAINLDNDGAIASAKCYGFKSCEGLSSCFADDLDAGTGTELNGFESCLYLSSCRATTIDNVGANGNGFESCTFISSCNAFNNGGNGFELCESLVSCNASSNGVDGFESCTNLSSCRATSNTNRGFDTCIAMGHNRSSGNGTNYNACFADWGTANAVGDTAAGGYNG